MIVIGLVRLTEFTCLILSRSDAHHRALLESFLAFTKDDTCKHSDNDYCTNGDHNDDAQHPIPAARHGHVGQWQKLWMISVQNITDVTRFLLKLITQ